LLSVFLNKENFGFVESLPAAAVVPMLVPGARPG
jgi:hypothetical protein